MKHERIAVWDRQIVLELDFIKGACALMARAADRLEALSHEDRDWEIIREIEEQKFILGREIRDREAAQ